MLIDGDGVYQLSGFRMCVSSVVGRLSRVSSV